MVLEHEEVEFFVLASLLSASLPVLPEPYWSLICWDSSLELFAIFFLKEEYFCYCLHSANNSGLLLGTSSIGSLCNKQICEINVIRRALRLFSAFVELDHTLAAFSEYQSLHQSYPDSDPSLVVSILDKMGAICTQLHDQSNARECYEDAVNVARSATDSRQPLSSVAARTVARSLYNLALIHSTEGRICEAIDCVEEAIQFGILESSSNTFCILVFVKQLYLKNGNTENAQKYSKKISELEQDAGSGGRPGKRSKPCGAPAA